MKRAHLRLLLNDPSEPLRFRVGIEGEGYTVYEFESEENLLSNGQDWVEWAARKIRKPTRT